jgi:hypothetical protein
MPWTKTPLARTRTIPTPSQWNCLVGPFYTSAEVAWLLGGVSRQALADRRQRRTILATKTADGVFVYPTFQFGADN